MLRFQPFDEQVEGLSHLWHNLYAVERPVQTDDFEQLTLLGDISREPLLREKMAAGSGTGWHCRIVCKWVKTGFAGAYNSHPFTVATAKTTRFELGWR